MYATAEVFSDSMRRLASSICGFTRAPISRAVSSIFSVISMMSPPVRTPAPAPPIAPQKPEEHGRPHEHRGPLRHPGAPVGPPRDRVPQRAHRPLDALARSFDRGLRLRHLVEGLRAGLVIVVPLPLYLRALGVDLGVVVGDAGLFFVVSGHGQCALVVVLSTLTLRLPSC